MSLEWQQQKKWCMAMQVADYGKEILGAREVVLVNYLMFC